jgi:hypothetical protein
MLFMGPDVRLLLLYAKRFRGIFGRQLETWQWRRQQPQEPGEAADGRDPQGGPDADDRAERTRMPVYGIATDET